MKIWFFSLLVGNVLSFANEDNQNYKMLNGLALKAHADKASDFHNYTETYAKYFSDLREKPIRFLEIGIDKGNSVKLWEEYFPNAELHFMDITLEKVEYFSNRSKYHITNQESPEDLQKFIKEIKGEFDVIIDDGGHTMNQQIISFINLFPQIKQGGMYIIEDLHTSYWAYYGGSIGLRRARTTIEFLKSLIDDLNFVGYRTGRASHLDISSSIANELNIYRESIESIHFYDSLAIIIKR